MKLQTLLFETRTGDRLLATLERLTGQAVVQTRIGDQQPRLTLINVNNLRDQRVTLPPRRPH